MPRVAVYSSNGDGTVASGRTGDNGTEHLGTIEFGGAEYYHVDTSELFTS